MIKINILSKSEMPFFAHWDKERFPEEEYEIKYNSTDDVEWDCVVVYQNLKNEVSFKCKSGRVLYFSGEPPLMVPCPKVFTSQFDIIVCPNPKIKHPHKILSHGYLNWSLGYGFFSKTHKYNYKQLAELEPPKTKLISIVSSNQRMLPGHNRRMEIIDKLQHEYAGVVDFYGRGFESVDFKSDAINPYKFHICIENTSMPDYWTEKIADPILAQSIPIYSGCTNIQKYLGKKGYFTFDINKYATLKQIIENVVANPDEIYSEMKDDLEELRKILMEKQNIISFLIDYINNNTCDIVKEYHIKPLDSTWQFKLQLYLIRIKRLIFKRIVFPLIKTRN